MFPSVKLYSVKPEYRASWEKEPAGKLTGSLKIKFDSPDAWTVCDLSSGHHYLPLFRGDLPGCLEHLQTAGFTRETFKVITIYGDLGKKLDFIFRIFWIKMRNL